MFLEPGTVLRLLYVVYILKREFINLIYMKTTVSMIGPHQYDDLGPLEAALGVAIDIAAHGAGEEAQWTLEIIQAFTVQRTSAYHFFSGKAGRLFIVMCLYYAAPGRRRRPFMCVTLSKTVGAACWWVVHCKRVFSAHLSLR